MKLLAESAGPASITVESGQLALRFPDGVLPENLPYLGENVRVGIRLMAALFGRC